MRRALLAVVAVMSLAVSARAADTHFVSESALDVATLLPAPPKTGSREWQAELETVLKMQATRTEAEVARATAEKKQSPDAFKAVLGEDFTAEHFPKLFSLLEDAAADSKVFSSAAKEHFARKGPGGSDPRVKPLSTGKDEPSYPSGHSTNGMMWGTILGTIAPELKDALVERGEEFGWDRVLAGAHFPNDVYGGRVLGGALAQKMLKDATFQGRLEEARAEYVAYRKAHPVQAPVAAAAGH